MTKLKKIQKENDMLRGQVDMLQRETDYWEHQAKTLEIRKAKLEAQLALWKGTAP
jgi:cell division protein FtsB